jgi:putative glutathione S-transferase
MNAPQPPDAIPRPAGSAEYHLYAAWGCPYTHRVLGALHVTGLADELPVTWMKEVKREPGWEIEAATDPAFGARYLHEIYALADPGGSHRPAVPLLIDRSTRRIVSTTSRDMTRFVAEGFSGLHSVKRRLNSPDTRAEIDALTPWINDRVNRAVYRVGFARDQESYESEAHALFAALDAMEARLTERPYLVGETLSEADLFLFATVARFDAIYHPLFRCSLRRIADYPGPSAYLERLLGDPDLAASFDLGRAKRNYFQSVIHRPDGIYEPNPSGIVPL